MISPERVVALLQARFPQEPLTLRLDGIHPHAQCGPQRWHEIARWLHDEPALRFNWLRCISAVDRLEDSLIALVYDLHAVRLSDGAAELLAEFTMVVHLPRAAPQIASVADIWPAANWHEREAYDLMGVTFTGHPDLRRILCCDDWVGHPLRKDYEFPLEYHGIPAVTEADQARFEH